MLAEPSPFACPDCLGPIFDDWKAPQVFLEGWQPTSELEFWSDGVITGASGEPRPIVSCPLCYSLFPYFAVTSLRHHSSMSDASKLDPKTPFIRMTSKPQDNSQAPVELSNVVRNPDWKHFRFLPSFDFLRENFDLLFISLIAESVLQSFNDKVRGKSRRGENVVSFVAEKSIAEFLENFIQMRRSAGATGSVESPWSGTSPYEFMGVARYFFLEVELERNLRNFEEAEVDLALVDTMVPEMLERAKMDNSLVPIDSSSEYPYIGQVNWELGIALQRLEQMSQAIEEGVPGLKLLKINLNS